MAPLVVCGDGDIRLKFVLRNLKQDPPLHGHIGRQVLLGLVSRKQDLKYLTHLCLSYSYVQITQIQISCSLDASDQNLWCLLLSQDA